MLIKSCEIHQLLQFLWFPPHVQHTSPGLQEPRRRRRGFSDPGRREVASDQIPTREKVEQSRGVDLQGFSTNKPMPPQDEVGKQPSYGS